MNSNDPANSQDKLIDEEDQSISLMIEIEEQLAIEGALEDFDPSGDPAFRERRLHLMKATAADLYSDALRNGRKAQAHKKQQKADYAAMVLETEGRAVRSYQKATPDRRREQKKAAKANRSPDQVKKEREADRIRKRDKRKAERLAIERQRKAIEDAAEF